MTQKIFLANHMTQKMEIPRENKKYPVKGHSLLHQVITLSNEKRFNKKRAIACVCKKSSKS